MKKLKYLIAILVVMLLNITNIFAIENESYVADIAVGQNHVLVLMNDGTLMSWGKNNFGQLGLDDTESHNTPTKIMGIDNIVAIASGANNSAAIDTNGDLWTWGYGVYGTIGDGLSQTSLVPTKVLGISNVIQVSIADFSMIALTENGDVYAWGRNQYGEVGDGTTIQRTSPVQVTALSDVIKISSGSSHHIALKSDGTIYAWGKNELGSVSSVGPWYNVLTPSQLTDLTNVIDIQGGETQSYAVLGNGEVWYWGYPEYRGQLTGVIKIQLASDINQISGAYNHVFMKSSNSNYYYVTGNDLNGEMLADGDSHGSQAVLAEQLSITDEVFPGDEFSVVLSETKHVYSVGNNDYGQLGQGNTENYSGLQEVSQLAPVNNNILDLRIDSGDEQISISWSENIAASSYNVYRSLVPGTGYSLYHENLTENIFVDRNVVNGESYYYCVTMVTDTEESLYSNEVNGIPAELGLNRALIIVSFDNGMSQEFYLKEDDFLVFESWFEARSVSEAVTDYYAIEKEVAQGLEGYVGLGHVTEAWTYLYFPRINSVEVVRYLYE